MDINSKIQKGRGVISNPEGRFESLRVETVDDGWTIGLSISEADIRGSDELDVSGDDEELPPLETIVTAEHPKSIITHNDSPDISFSQSINPYRGCEHGCTYCYARPAHSYVNLSPGLDFETKLFYKKNAAELLDKELRRPRYNCTPIHIGGNTDPYQPIERQLKVTRSILEVLQRFRQPFSIITKGALIERDIDILSEMARDGLVSTYVSITSLENELKRTLEPRTASPAARLRTVQRLSNAGIPVGVMVAPVIPAINDHEIERILEAAVRSGAQSAGHVMLRLPHEVKDLFREWLQAHHPLRAGHVMSLVQQMRGGRDNDPNFGSRMQGQGAYAQLIHARFNAVCARLGLNLKDRKTVLTTRHFRVPQPLSGQMSLL